MDSYMMIILAYLAVMCIIINGQETSSNMCDLVEASCVSQTYDATINILVNKLNNLEKILQKADEERSFLMSEIENLREQLNNITDNQSVFGRPSDCAGLYNSGHRTSGAYTVYPTDINNVQHTVQVYCDMTTSGGGWTVFQRQYDGSVPFNRTWEEYKNGFGKILGELWMGNHFISMMTNKIQTKYRLRVDLKAFDGQTRYAEYTDFKVEPECAKFRLNIRTYSGTAGDSLSGHKDMFFSTRDRDNDKYSSGSCSIAWGSGGFWYNACASVNINSANTIVWHAWLVWQRLQATSMMFRPMDFP